MSHSDLDERYLTWLVGHIASVKDRVRARTHWALFRQLHKAIFVSVIPHDENRIADAKNMRYEFLALHEGERGNSDWIRQPCSVLELLIVLSDFLSFETDERQTIWFFHLIEMLGLQRYTDAHFNDEAEEIVDEAINRLIWRTYNPDGSGGGLFPLNHAKRDMREVELWYQLNAYLLENF